MPWLVIDSTAIKLKQKTRPPFQTIINFRIRPVTTTTTTATTTTTTKVTSAATTTVTTAATISLKQRPQL